jgi:hypothetical protein
MTRARNAISVRLVADILGLEKGGVCADTDKVIIKDEEPRQPGQERGNVEGAGLNRDVVKLRLPGRGLIVLDKSTSTGVAPLVVIL